MEFNKQNGIQQKNTEFAIIPWVDLARAGPLDPLASYAPA